jgi:hypothetical protein
MAEHFWTELKMTPVEVDEQPDGTLDVHATTGAMDIAEEDAKYGCWFCFTELDADSFHTRCDYDPAQHGPGEDHRQS